MCVFLSMFVCVHIMCSYDYVCVCGSVKLQIWQTVKLKDQEKFPYQFALIDETLHFAQTFLRIARHQFKGKSREIASH